MTVTGHLLLRDAKQFDKVAFHIVRFDIRCVSLDRFSITIDRELGKVPLDRVDQGAAFLHLQILEDRMCIRSIHVNLRVHVERNIELFGHKLLDLRLGARLLSRELIARKCCDTKTIRLIFTIQCLKLRVVFRCCASVARNINDDDNISFVFLE